MNQKKVVVKDIYDVFFSYTFLGDNMRLSDLQNKDIVNITDGRNVGSIIDVKIDENTGNIVSFIIEPNRTFFSFFNKGQDTEINWQSITKIGEDVILVKLSL